VANFNLYDFEDIRNAMIAELNGRQTWSGRKDTEVGQTFVHIVAFLTSEAVKHLNRTVQNAYPTSSMSKYAVTNFARFIGYTPKRKMSAVGKVKVVLSAPQATPVLIPETYTAATRDGITVCLDRWYQIGTGNTELEIDVIQGYWDYLTVSGTGEKNQYYFVLSENIENTFFKVYVDGFEWTEVSNFNASIYTSEHYTVRPILGGLQVSFGDGVHGKVPMGDREIMFKWIESLGARGNIYKSGSTILRPGATLFNTLGQEVEHELVIPEVQDISGNIIAPIQGGTDGETWEDVRANIPPFLTTATGILTRRNYIDFLRSQPYILDANVWPAWEQRGEDICTMNLTSICIVPSTGGSLTQELIDRTENMLVELTTIENKREYIPPDYVQVVFSVYVRPNPFENFDVIRNNIRTTITEAMLWTNRVKNGGSLFQGLSHSIFVTSIQENTAGIKDVLLSFLVRSKIVTVSDEDVRHYTFQSPIGSIEPFSVEVRLGTTIIARDNGVGEFVAESGRVLTGAISYSSGSGHVVIGEAGGTNPGYDQPQVGGEYSIYYKQLRGGDNLLADIDIQVFDLYDIEVSIEE